MKDFDNTTKKIDDLIEKGAEEELGEAVLQIIDSFHGLIKDIEQRQENKAWKNIEPPFNLRWALGRLTKDDLNKIRQNFGFKNISSLKKADLIETLAVLVPLMYKNTLYALDENRYEHIKLMVAHSGVIPDMGLSFEKISVLQKNCLAFTGVYDNKKVLFITDELINIFQGIDDINLKNMAKRNTKWISLAGGMLYYYGAMAPITMMKRIEDLMGQEVDYKEFIEVLYLAGDYYKQFHCDAFGYKNIRVRDGLEVLLEHKKRTDIEFYPFTMDQLIAAGDPDYVDITKEARDFIAFLRDNYELSDGEETQIIQQLNDTINAGAQPEDIYKKLSREFQIPTAEYGQVFMTELTKLYNGTRRWILKGHTPNELDDNITDSTGSTRHQVPHVASRVTYQLPNAASNVTYQAPHAAGKKIGRNDPCPCGSGKKYKKCCGR